MSISRVLFLFLSIGIAFPQSPVYNVSTVAGSTRPLNDGGPATGALLYNPQGIVVDPVGNVYFSDQGNHRVRKIDIAGRITTFAGTGTRGYSGDNGPATSAQMVEPYGLALDAAGNLYIADWLVDSVRKVSTDGTITTVAGNGTTGFSGDNGPATAARLSGPYAVAVDKAGNLFIADTGNNRIRKVTPGGIITTVAGTGDDASIRAGGPALSEPISEPRGLAFDASGSLYVAEYGTGRISKIDINGNLTTFAGTFNYNYSAIGDAGPALNATMIPQGLAFDAGGTLYFADTLLNRIRKINTGGIVTTVTGTGIPGYTGDGGPAGAAQISEPFAVAPDASGNLYFTDTGNHRVRKVNLQSLTVNLAAGGGVGISDGGPAVQAQLFAPSGQAVDAAGNLYIADTNNHRVRKVSLSGVISTVAGTGTAGYSGDGGPATQAQLAGPAGVWVDSLGQLLITDTNNSAIRRVNLNGTIQTIAGTGFAGFGGDSGPAARALLAYPSVARTDASGNIFIADTYNARIRVISPTGTITTFAGPGTGASGDGGPATAATLLSPTGVAADSKGNVYIADFFDFAIRKVGTDGKISTLTSATGVGFTGDGGPSTAARVFLPYDIAADASGNVYFSDSGNERIRMISSAGIISTIAGYGASGFSGDNGPAVNAQFESLLGLALDSSGSIYVADGDNHRIRKLTKQAVVPDFSLSADAAAKNVNAGGTVVVTLTVASQNGFSGSVTLASTGLPAGSVTFAPSNVVTLAAGQSATVTATMSVGSSTNASTLTGVFSASSAGLQHQVTVTFTVVSVPVISAGGVVNAASFASGAVAPGEIVTIYGAGIGPATLTTLALDAAGKVATTLSNTTVTFDGHPAPLIYVSAGQISAIVPYAVAGQTSSQVQVAYNGKTSASLSVAITDAAPALFTANSSGVGLVAATNQDGSLNSAANRAPVGTVVVLYGTGEGQTSPGGVDGQLATAVYPAPVAKPTVTVGGVPAEVLYAGAAPGLVAGVIQFNVRIPSGLVLDPLIGTAEVVISMGTGKSPLGVTIGVR